MFAQSRHSYTDEVVVPEEEKMTYIARNNHFLKGFILGKYSFPPRAFFQLRWSEDFDEALVLEALEQSKV